MGTHVKRDRMQFQIEVCIENWCFRAGSRGTYQTMVSSVSRYVHKGEYFPLVVI